MNRTETRRDTGSGDCKSPEQSEEDSLGQPTSLGSEMTVARAGRQRRGSDHSTEPVCTGLYVCVCMGVGGAGGTLNPG